jgi:hypothetical protein
VRSYTGAGNIVGRVLSGVFDRTLLTQHGTAGVRSARPRTTSLDLAGRTRCWWLHSDGIETRWTAERSAGAGRDPTLVAAVLLRDHTATATTPPSW